MHKRKISITGLGYVGLQVATAFSAHGKVIGIDTDPQRVKQLQKGIDSNSGITLKGTAKNNIIFTCDTDEISVADFHIISVPTPVDCFKRPDLHPLLDASKMVGSQLKNNDIVVYESTVYPGATEEDCIPILEKASGLKAGTDFFVGYSPERINPGDEKHHFASIKKIVSAQDQKTLDIIAKVYGSVVDAGIYRVNNIMVAEAAKVIENIQRDLNIALMNEFALIFQKMGIDTRDVLDAAATKWNFLRFEPGLVGGHCIGVDPYYLTHKAATMNYASPVIMAGRKINDAMGTFIAQQTVKNLLRAKKNLVNCTVTILGLTFKENVSDLRNTQVINIINELKEYGLHVQVCDPCADSASAMKEYNIKLISLDKIEPANAVILAVPHRNFMEYGWELITQILDKNSGIVIDVKAALSKKQTPPGIDLWRL